MRTADETKAGMPRVQDGTQNEKHERTRTNLRGRLLTFVRLKHKAKHLEKLNENPDDENHWRSWNFAGHDCTLEEKDKTQVDGVRKTAR